MQRDKEGHEIKETGVLANVLDMLGRFTYDRARLIIVLTVIVAIISAIGISKININDNPVKWFDKKHEIRVADSVLNEHFGGTYLAYLALEADQGNKAYFEQYYQGLTERVAAFLEDVGEDYPERSAEFKTQLATLYEGQKHEANLTKFNENVSEFIRGWETLYADDEDASLFIEELVYFWDEETLYTETFKQPEILSYIAKLEEYMTTEGAGKSSSLAGISRMTPF